MRCWHSLQHPSSVSALRASGMDDVLVIAGGIIPKEDAEALLARGVSAIFPPGTPISDIVAFIQQNARLPA